MYPFSQARLALGLFEPVFLAHEKASLFISLLAQRNSLSRVKPRETKEKAYFSRC
jgi:hypothetical protein